MYSTVTDVRNALAPGSVREGTAATLTDQQIIDAINQADALIRSKIGHLYIIPLETVDIPAQGENPASTEEFAEEPVRYWSRDIAAYLVTLTYKRNADVSENDPVRLRMNLAMAGVTEVQRGQATLPFPPYVPPGQTSADAAVINQYTGDLFGAEDFDLAPVGFPHRFGTWPGGPQ